SLAIVAILQSWSKSPLLARADPPEPQWKQFLAWLPEDTETLIVTQRALAIPESDDHPLRFDKELLWLSAGPLLGVQDGLFTDELTGQRIACAVEGSRRFTPPKGFSSFRYQGA